MLELDTKANRPIGSTATEIAPLPPVYSEEATLVNAHVVESIV